MKLPAHKASYWLGIAGYGAGMALSLLGYVPVGLLFIVGTGIVATALFFS